MSAIEQRILPDPDTGVHHAYRQFGAGQRESVERSNKRDCDTETDVDDSSTNSGGSSRTPWPPKLNPDHGHSHRDQNCTDDETQDARCHSSHLPALIGPHTRIEVGGEASQIGS